MEFPGGVRNLNNPNCDVQYIGTLREYFYTNSIKLSYEVFSMTVQYQCNISVYKGALFFIRSI